MKQPATFNRVFAKLAWYAAALSLLVVQISHAQASGLVPCDGDDCTINSVVQLMNNIMNFFFKVLLLPIFVIMILYLGYQYLTAGGKPGMHAKLGRMAMHMVGGLVLILCAWLIVKAILAILGYSDPFGFFG